MNTVTDTIALSLVRHHNDFFYTHTHQQDIFSLHTQTRLDVNVIHHIYKHIVDITVQCRDIYVAQKHKDLALQWCSEIMTSTDKDYVICVNDSSVVCCSSFIRCPEEHLEISSMNNLEQKMNQLIEEQTSVMTELYSYIKEFHDDTYLKTLKAIRPHVLDETCESTKFGFCLMKDPVCVKIEVSPIFPVLSVSISDKNQVPTTRRGQVERLISRINQHVSEGSVTMEDTSCDVVFVEKLFDYDKVNIEELVQEKLPQMFNSVWGLYRMFEKSFVDTIDGIPADRAFLDCIQDSEAPDAIDIQDAREKGICTFSITRENHTEQSFRTCMDCFEDDDSGVCIVCAEKCHKGHRLGPMQIFPFYCDCGSDMISKRCQAKDSYKQSSENVKLQPAKIDLTLKMHS